MLNRFFGVAFNFFLTIKLGRLGRGCKISFLESWSYLKNIEIGDYVYIGPGARLFGLGGVVIGDGTIIGPKVCIYSSNHDFYSNHVIPYSNETLRRKCVKIGAGCWIGERVMIMPGTIIGNHCLVGAGSVVRGHYKAGSVVIGNPSVVVDNVHPDLLGIKNNLLNSSAFLLKR